MCGKMKNDRNKHQHKKLRGRLVKYSKDILTKPLPPPDEKKKQTKIRAIMPKKCLLWIANGLMTVKLHRLILSNNYSNRYIVLCD